MVALPLMGPGSAFAWLAVMLTLQVFNSLTEGAFTPLTELTISSGIEAVELRRYVSAH